ncbi:hypothetical protein [Sulfitobacter sp. JB4-11]|uniref:hypothetical protein n=1 Tax=Sulfitobacter rhodophyticola TaxID=3238304 RepID=UPI00351754B3
MTAPISSCSAEPFGDACIARRRFGGTKPQMYQEVGCLRQLRTPTASSRTDTKTLIKTPNNFGRKKMPENPNDCKNFVKIMSKIGQLAMQGWDKEKPRPLSS